MKPLVLAGEYSQYHSLFERTAENLNGADFILFTGGTDVDSTMYGEQPHETNQAPDVRRDEFEKSIYRAAITRGIPVCGICRGAQFLNVMNGGYLIQNVNNHLDYHLVKTDDDKEFSVSSSHHQMMVPLGDHKLLAWAENVATSYEGEPSFGKYPALDRDPEAIYFPVTQSLCVQWHPEWMDKNTMGYSWFIEAVERYMRKN